MTALHRVTSPTRHLDELRAIHTRRRSFITKAAARIADVLRTHEPDTFNNAFGVYAGPTEAELALHLEDLVEDLDLYDGSLVNRFRGDNRARVSVLHSQARNGRVTRRLTAWLAVATLVEDLDPIDDEDPAA